MSEPEKLMENDESSEKLKSAVHAFLEQEMKVIKLLASEKFTYRATNVCKAPGCELKKIIVQLCNT